MENKMNKFGGEKSSVVVEVVSAKARHILPAKMFNIE